MRILLSRDSLESSNWALPCIVLSGLRQCALVPGHGTRVGSSPHGDFLMNFGQCMGLVPTQYRQKSEELCLVADSGYGY